MSETENKCIISKNAILLAGACLYLSSLGVLLNTIAVLFTAMTSLRKKPRFAILLSLSAANYCVLIAFPAAINWEQMKVPNPQ